MVSSILGMRRSILRRDHLDHFPTKNYFVCEKTRGERYLLLLTRHYRTREPQLFLIDRDHQYHAVTMAFPKAWTNDFGDAILDGELTVERSYSGIAVALKVTDCLTVDGSYIAHPYDGGRDLKGRLRVAKRVVESLNEASEIAKYPLPFTLELVQMCPANRLTEQLGQWRRRRLENDGIWFKCDAIHSDLHWKLASGHETGSVLEMDVIAASLSTQTPPRSHWYAGSVTGFERKAPLPSTLPTPKFLRMLVQL